MSTTTSYLTKQPTCVALFETNLNYKVSITNEKRKIQK